MNRAERRRHKKKDDHEPIINLKSSDIKRIKEQAACSAIDTSFLLMLAIPTMVIHDKYSLLMKREVDGKSREERFTDLCLDLYDSFEKGYVTLDDLSKCLYEETGIKMVKIRR